MKLGLRKSSIERLQRVLSQQSKDKYLTTQPKGWGAADGLRSKKDQAAWKDDQYSSIDKAKKIMNQELGYAQPGDEVFAQEDEVNATTLAEIAAQELGHDEWLDDETHWIWDVAMDVAIKWNQSHGWE